MRGLSQSKVVAMAVLTAIVFMIFLYLVWMASSSAEHTFFDNTLNLDGATSTHVILDLFLSALMGLFVYQALMNKMRTRALNNTSQQLNTLIQNLPGLVYRVVINVQEGTEERVKFLSDRCEELTGYDPEYILQGHMGFVDIIDKADLSKVVAAVQHAVNTRSMYDFECRIHTKSGELRWFWHRGRAVGKDNHPSACIEGFVSDITARKKAELALKEARAYSEAVVDTAVEAVITINSQGIIKTYNRSAEHMFGYTQYTMQGQDICKLMPLPFINAQSQSIEKFIAVNKARILNVDKDLTGTHENGSVFPIELSISEVPHQKDATYVCLVRDISQQRAAEDEARLHRDQLAHVDRLNALGEMASGIAHEVNQPLAAISLFAQAGKRFLECGQADRVPEVFDKLSKHAQRAGEIIERIQAMAKQHKSIKKTCTCSNLLAEVSQLAESEARTYDIKIALSIDESTPNVCVDAVQIQQVILNLLRNGMQAMRSVQCCNGNIITLRVRQNSSSDIEFAVIDSGDGVHPDAEKMLFEPFSTTKDTGMGMGLSISRAIIEAHDGNISFHHNTDHGATFYFTLPCVQQHTENDNEVSSNESL